MNIGIVGGGAVGLLIASYLSINKHNITVYVKRKAQKERITKSGLKLLPGEKRLPASSLLIDERKKEDIIIVCVKQYHLPELMGDLEKFDCPVVFVQNGMGHLEILEQLPEMPEIIVGTMEHGAMKMNDSEVKHTGQGQLNLSLLRGDTKIIEKIATEWHSEHFPIRIEPGWYQMLAKKLIVNAVINPLTAIFQVKNGELIKNKYLFELSERLFREAVSVLELNSGEQWERLLAVIEKTKDNHSSMKMDIAEQRQTEVDGILGYLMRHSKNDIPYIQFAYNAIKALRESGCVKGITNS